MVYIFYNRLAGNGTGKTIAEKLASFYPDRELNFIDLISLEDVNTTLRTLGTEDTVVLAGGDGTLNRFINAIGDAEYPFPIYLYPAGSGNDFYRDVTSSASGDPVDITPYIKDLPTVTVNGITKRFINGIGFGIDGYCCEVGDKLKEKSDKPVNYTAIAIKGLLFHYKPVGARVIVDGREFCYRKVWLCPTMLGRYYGGGMMVAPAQDRTSADKTVSAVLMYGSGKLKTLAVFPSIFKGEHLAHTEMTAVHVGHEITVKFDTPTALQIDGESIPNVTEYTVTAKVTAKN